MQVVPTKIRFTEVYSQQIQTTDGYKHLSGGKGPKNATEKNICLDVVSYNKHNYTIQNNRQNYIQHITASTCAIISTIRN